MKKFILNKNQTQNQTIILLIIICIIIILIVIINKYYEKFTDPIGKYDYMAPVTETITDEMWQILYNKMDKLNVPEVLSVDNIKKKYTNFITKTEIYYYLDNDKFQWNSYVTKLFIDLMSNSQDPSGISPEDSVKETMKIYPNRYAYNQYLLSPDMKEKLSGDAYLIYSGDKN